MSKHLILAIAALLLSTTVFSQETTTTETTEQETSSIIYDGSAYGFAFAWGKKERMCVHLPGLSFTFANLNGLDDIPYADLKEGRSYSIGLELGNFTANLVEHWVLGTGLRLDFTRYHFKGNVGLRDLQGYELSGEPIGKTFSVFVPDPEGREYKSSKLIAYYVAVPVVVEYQTKFNRNNRFFVNAGVEGLIKYYSKSQVDVKKQGGVDKETLGKDMNIPALSARLVFNIGFDSFGLTAYYQPHSLFKNNRGPEVYPWGIGLAVGF